MGVLDQMRDEFVAEAEELLDEIGADLLALDKLGTEASPDLLRKVLRSVHSLKGSSGMFGFEDLSKASHSLEGMLDDLKEGRARDARELIEASLDQIEVMRHFLRDGGNGLPPKRPPTEIAEHASEARQEKACDLEDPSASPPDAPNKGEEYVRVALPELDHTLNLVNDLLLSAATLKYLQRILRHAGVRPSEHQQRTATARLMEHRLCEVRESLLNMRMVPIGKIFKRLVPAVRSLTRDTGKDVRLRIQGGDTRLDKIIAEQLGDPLLHIIRNAVDHGIEKPSQRTTLRKPREGHVSLSARREGTAVVIEVSDDGQGIDLEKVVRKATSSGLLSEGESPSKRQILECLFAPGLSTADKVGSVSGRGVGMDVVRCNVLRLSGSVQIETETGVGTTVSIRVPPTLSTLDGLLVAVDGQVFVFPFHAVVEVLRLSAETRQQAIEEGWLSLRERSIPSIPLGSVFGFNGDHGDLQFALIIGRGQDRLAVLVDRLRERSEVLVKPLGPGFHSLDALSGATELPDGHVALVLDVPSVIKGAIGVGGTAE